MALQTVLLLPPSVSRLLENELDMLLEVTELPLERALEHQEPVIPLWIGRPFRSVCDLVHRFGSNQVRHSRKNMHHSSRLRVRGKAALGKEVM